MPEQLPPEIRDETDALCRKISVAHNLDAEIQEELRGHIEDKVLAYLNGEEAVTPADAMLLAREHFGDARTLKGLLREVHAPDAQATFARKLLAIAVVSLLVSCLYRFLSQCLIVWYVSSAARGIPAAVHYGAVLAEGVLAVFPFLCTALVLLWFHRRIQRKRLPWYLRLTPATLLLWSFATVLFALFLVPSVQTSISMPSNSQVQIGPLLTMTLRILHFSLAVGTAVLWIWWLDTAPRHLTTTALAVLAHVAFRPVMIALILQSRYVSPHFLLDSSSLWSFQLAPIFRMDSFWSFHYAFAAFLSISARSIQTVLPSVGIAVVLYAMWAALRKWREATNLAQMDRD